MHKGIISQTKTQEEAGINKWLVFLIISFSLFMMTMNSTIVATALTTMQRDLGTTVSWIGWTMTAYAFGFVLMLPLSAKLSIRYGHRRIFLIAVAIFTLGSLFCGLSENIYLLISMRVLQASGGAGVTPSATGLIVEYFGESRDKFLGVFGSVFSVGALIGPIFGGFFVTYWTWPWIFFINIPIGILSFVLAMRFIPKDILRPGKKEKMDFVGLLFLGIALICAMYAATYLSGEGTSPFSTLFIGLITVALLSFWFFFNHLRKVKNPFIQPRFITGKGFGAVNVVNVVFTGVTIGAISLVPFYAVHRYGISELSSGTILVAEGIASVLLSVIMSMLIRRTGYRMPIFTGGILLTIGLLLLAVEPQFGLSPFVWLASSTFLMGLGFGFMNPAARNAGIQLAPEQSANIAAIRSVGLQLGQIFFIAIATAIISASTNPNLAQAMIYVGVAVLLLAALPIIPRIPEKRGAW